MNQQRTSIFSLSTVLPKLIFLNVVRHLPRLWAMGVALIIIFALLVMGNTLLDHSSAGFRDVYAAAVTGNLTISDAAADGFTVFGSEALLVAELHVTPTVLYGGRLLESLRGTEGVQAATGLVSALVRTETGDPTLRDPAFLANPPSRARQEQVFFGVNFSEYFALFPGIELLSGALPAPGEAAILLQPDRYAELQEAFGREDIVGLPLVASSASDTSFTIRELRIAGSFRYSFADPQLARVALADAQTVRALAGHVAGHGVAADAGAVDFGFSDPADLFSEPAHSGPEAMIEEEGITLDEVEGLFAERAEASQTQAQAGSPDVWNFLLLRSTLPVAAVERSMADAGFPVADYLVRDWRESAGGTAQLVYVLQLLMNAALGFVTLGAWTVTANALVLSVLERGAELGTLQAMGAGRGFVALLIAGEAVVFVSLSATLGVTLGALVGLGLDTVRIELANPIIATLFGGNHLPLRPRFALLLAHVAAGVLLALLAVLYPLKRVFEISPVQAMSGDATLD